MNPMRSVCRLALCLIVSMPSARAKRQLTAAKTDTAPTVDGRLDEACWKTAPVADGFSVFSDPDRPHPEQTAGRVCYDEDRLYIAVECQVGDVTSFRRRLAETDRELDFDRGVVVEVFGLRRRFVLSDDATRTTEHKRVKPVPAGLLRCQVQTSSRGFSIEIAISLPRLGLGPDTDRTWGFNLNRTHDLHGGASSNDARYSSWNSTQGQGFQTPACFGELLLDADLSRFCWQAEAVSAPDRNGEVMQWRVTNQTGKDVSGKALLRVTGPAGEVGRHAGPLSLEAGATGVVSFNHSPAGDAPGTAYELSIADANGRLLYAKDMHRFRAAAIIRDGPFYTRERYRQEHPQVCVREDDFIYNRTLYVSPDHIVPRGITYSHNEEKAWLKNKEKDFGLVFELPDGVEVVGLRESEGLEPHTVVLPRAEPFRRDNSNWVRYVLTPSYITHRPDRTAVHMVYYKTRLPPGSTAEGLYYLTFKGGRQEPQTIRIESIRIPKVRPPKRFFVGAWHMETADLKLMCPDFPDDFTSLGLNTINLYYVGHWQDSTERLKTFYEFGDPTYRAARENGLFVMYNNFFPWAPRSQYGMRNWVKSDPSARALDIDGKTVPNYAGYMLCPSYRGAYYREALDRLQTFSQLRRWPASYFNMDMEIYGGRGRQVCFCERCVNAFEQWFAQNCPDLEYIDPFALNREVERAPAGGKDYTVTTKYPGHYHAWVRFKIEQFANMWKGMTETISKTVRGVRTAPFDDVVIADWAAVYPTELQREDAMYGLYTMEHGIQLYAVGAYGPAGLLFQPNFEGFVDFYYRQLGRRRSMYDTAPVSGYGWSGPFVATKPERTRYYLLETAMNGVQGVLLYPYSGLEGKQLALNAVVFDTFRLVDDLITEGERIDDLTVSGEDMHVRGLRIGRERLVLVGDNYVATDRREAVLTCPVEARVDVYDALKRTRLGELTPEQHQIRLVLDGLDDRARFLYIGNSWQERLTR